RCVAADADRVTVAVTSESLIGIGYQSRRQRPTRAVPHKNIRQGIWIFSYDCHIAAQRDGQPEIDGAVRDQISLLRPRSLALHKNINRAFTTEIVVGEGKVLTRSPDDCRVAANGNRVAEEVERLALRHSQLLLRFPGFTSPHVNICSAFVVVVDAAVSFSADD